jgi:c-di-AMP phosphodiesterase-like protein
MKNFIFFFTLIILIFLVSSKKSFKKLFLEEFNKKLIKKYQKDQKKISELSDLLFDNGGPSTGKIGWLQNYSKSIPKAKDITTSFREIVPGIKNLLNRKSNNLDISIISKLKNYNYILGFFKKKKLKKKIK